MNRPDIYKRPDKPLTLPVRRRRREGEAIAEAQTPEIITVDATTECHVTPFDVAERMVGYLGPVGDYMTLEPSAGTGQLIRALLASGHSPCELCAVERHTGLFHTLHKIDGISGAGLVNRCFLEWTEDAKCSTTFPRIIMNPPFRKVRQHMDAALSLLDGGGHDSATLIALVPVTYQHPDAEEMETLPNDTFASAKVFTKIMRIEK
jgi:hypothetical protein